MKSHLIFIGAPGSGKGTQAAKFVSDNEIAVLPQRDVIQKCREGIKWNPQDEKCIDVRIIVRETDDKVYKISGCMFVKQ